MKVDGEDMADAGICKGDGIMVRKKFHSDEVYVPGVTCLVRIKSNDTWLAKQLIASGRKVKLRSWRKDVYDYICRYEDVEIKGIIDAVVRWPERRRGFFRGGG